MKRFGQILGKIKMSDKLFLVWNGWAILFTGLIAIWQFLHYIVTKEVTRNRGLRNALAFIPLLSIPLAIWFSGWVAGILAFPIGMILGISLTSLRISITRVLIPPDE